MMISDDFRGNRSSSICLELKAKFRNDSLEAFARDFFGDVFYQLVDSLKNEI